MKANISNWAENLPAALQGSRLVLSESDIRTVLPVPMHGRVDQVFQTRSGWLVPVDTKRRKVAKVYFKDVVQLSAYRFILERASLELFGVSLPVSLTGYIRIPSGRSAIYLPVKLLTSAQVIAMWNRYWQLKNQKMAAKPKVPEAWACSSCPKRAACPRGSKIGGR